MKAQMFFISEYCIADVGQAWRGACCLCQTLTET